MTQGEPLITVGPDDIQKVELVYSLQGLDPFRIVLDRLNDPDEAVVRLRGWLFAVLHAASDHPAIQGTIPFTCSPQPADEEAAE